MAFAVFSTNLQVKVMLTQLIKQGWAYSDTTVGSNHLISVTSILISHEHRITDVKLFAIEDCFQQM